MQIPLRISCEFWIAFILAFTAGCGPSISNQAQPAPDQQAAASGTGVTVGKVAVGVGAAVEAVAIAPMVGAALVVGTPLLMADDVAKCGDPVWTLAGSEKKYGMNCQQYHAWRNAGFSKEEIATWRIVSSPEIAKSWKEAGFKPADAQVGAGNISPSEAAQWQTAGFSIRDAASWSSRLSLDDAIVWRGNGFALEKANQFLTAYPRITPEQASRLQNAGLMPQECAAHSLSIDQAIVWKDKGFSCAEAGSWKDVGADSEEAARWKAAGLEPDSVYLSKEGVSAETAASWKAAGISLNNENQVQQVRRFLDKGYDLKKATYYMSHGLEPNQVAEFNKVAAVCHNSSYNLLQLLYTSPFATTNKCFVLNPVAIQQWLNPSTGLASIAFGSSRVALVHFDKPPTNSVFGGVFLGVGAYQYESASGSLETVPSLKWIGQSVGR